MSIDLEELAAVIRLIKEAEFSEFRYAKGDVSLVVRRGTLPHSQADGEPATIPAVPPAKMEATPPTPAVLPQVANAAASGKSVTAPLLGTFYAGPKPGEPPFVRLGDSVEPDTVVCIIEVMKLMMSVNAGVAGVITAIHVRDGELVEHGQGLFSIEPKGRS